MTQDSESKNSGGQKLLMEEKQEDSNPSLKIVSLVSDAVHVSKSKRQDFSNWFL